MNASPATRSSRTAHLLVGGASFGLLAAAFAPLSWTLTVFFAPALWFAWAAAHPERGYWTGFVAAMSAWGGTLLCWISSLAGAPEAGFIGWLVVSLIFLVYSLPFGWALKRLLTRTRYPLVVIVPAVMTAFDAVRRFGSAGIAWHDPGYALHDWTLWIQTADLARVYPLNFLLWALNGLLADILLTLLGTSRRPSRRALVSGTAGCAVGLACILGYGAWRMKTIESQLREGPKLCGIQPNISQKERLTNGGSHAEARYQSCLELMAAASAREPDIDLFVWPETSFFRVDDSPADPKRPNRPPSLTAMLNQRRVSTRRSVAEEFSTACSRSAQPPKFLLGMVAYDEMPDGLHDERGIGIRERNSAFLLEYTPQEGRSLPFLAATERADKQKLVPFGEYIPFPFVTWKRRKLAEWVEATAGYLPAMTRGTRTALWNTDLGGRRHKFSVNICYEVVFPEIFAEGRRQGAEFVINTSNDAWYDDSAERDLCQAQIRFRAVENRLSMFRLSNTGISTAVDPLGRTDSNTLEKNEKGTLSARIDVGAKAPPAVWAGPWCERILVVLLFLMSIFGLDPKRPRG